MKKQLIVDGQKVEMTFEEVLVRFKPMINKEVRKHTATTNFNGIEAEDLYQALTLYVWNAFNDYDIERGTQFSTLLYNYLRDGKKRETSHLFAEKRTAEHGIFSIDVQTNSDSEDGKHFFHDTYEDFSLNTERCYDEKELYNLVFSNLSDMERDVLEILLCEVDGQRGDKKAFAEKWGFSRPTAYKKISEISEKLQVLVLQNGYSLC